MRYGSRKKQLFSLFYFSVFSIIILSFFYPSCQTLILSSSILLPCFPSSIQAPLKLQIILKTTLNIPSSIALQDSSKLNRNLNKYKELPLNSKENDSTQ